VEARIIARGFPTIAAVAVLKAWRRRQLQEWMALGLGQRPVFVFTDALGEPVTPGSVSRRFDRLTHQAGLPAIGFHGLRHTHATLLLAAGRPVIEVQRRLGHAKPSITMDIYGHAVKGPGRASADTFAQLLDAARGG
jgi:integrase